MPEGTEDNCSHANSQDYSGCRHPDHAKEGCVCRICAAAKDSGPAKIPVKYDTVETYRAAQNPLPPGLPRPVCPQEPNWFEIGWEFLRGRSINDMIWARWFPPRAKDYAGILHPCSRFADLGEVDDTELYRLDENIRKISYQMEREEKAKE